MKKLISLSLASVLLLAGCGSSASAAESSVSESQETASPSAAAEAAVSEESAAFPVAIKHVYGDTVIESKPERVVTLAFGNQDVVLSLGIVPVGFSAANYGVQDDSGMLPWTKEKLEELGEENPNVFQDTDGIDYEAVADCDPDIILAPYSGLTQEEYDMLTKIAPTIAYPEQAWTISTEDWISVTAQALGVPEKGQEVIDHMHDVIEKKKSAHPEFEGKTFVWITFNEDDLSALHAYSPDDSRCKFLTEFGFSYPESISEYVQDGKYSLDISAENADLLYDADFLIGYSTEAGYAAAAADPVLGEIPALKKNAVVSIDSGTPLSAALTMTPLSFDYTIDEYTDKLAEAVSHSQAE